MMEKEVLYKINRIIIVLAVASATFILDITLPLGVAGGVPYVLLILTGLLFSTDKIFIYLGVFATILTWIGFFLSPENAALWIVITNRCYAMVAIWTTVFILSLKKKEKSLREEITWREELELKLYEAIKSADKTKKEKSAFFASMSHDLRTPLNAIIGFSDLINNKIHGEETFDKYFEYSIDIHNSSQYLLQLINDILDMSKIESGHFILNKSEVDLPEIVYSCRDLLSVSAAQKNISVKIDIVDDIKTINADPLALKQILVNLMSNSIKFTPEGGKVTLDVKHSGSENVISIQDTGRGISADALETIAEPFVRDENNSSKTEEGTGLGLSIVKALVNLHNGDLKIESKLGSGTTVTVALPA
ncbi:MAG: HAMP domain-containing histidine kinase [Kordiimonadaceae bacterium]|jgi:two-component system, cell cycle sensor histidine kinase PleC|nr:HAMP domain-containing histidine kinase [Kordiimonadaceae bacterium]MBT6037491.1 HAMP domain-containing histidine kinase [Kordiimonadaceae bacterium]MBT6329156.1 HAMP domain-containing histidine kinase [Kordiimonadaceae bacterium]MBT7582705.1 HAMP domain-containing histidine kinase [Kordiimonadaceae bacterium]